MEVFKQVSVIIPSLNPDEKLKKTVEELLNAGFDDIILVDDGSEQQYKKYFPDENEFPQITLLVHDRNRGKGAALKTAFSFYEKNRVGRAGVVTADGDGQHTLSDIVKCSQAMIDKEEVILGARNFSEDGVPFKSRAGNNITRFVLKTLCGINIGDTQTGLRAVPSKYVDILTQIEGQRYDYETNMLLEFKKKGISMVDVPIETVYIDDNKASHFHPFRDSFLVYFFILKYLMSSLVSAGVDLGLFWLLSYIFGSGHVILFTVLARVVSSLTNFTINKKAVFKNNSDIKSTIIRYYTLAIPQMLVSGGSVKLLSLAFGVGESSGWVTLIKLIIDTILFFISYRIQHSWVFKEDNGEKKMKETKNKKTGGKLTAKTVVKRVFACLGTLILYAVIAVFSVCAVLLNGPSKTIRDTLVLSAMQASATKWVPGLFLSDKTVNQIIEDSKKVNTETVDIDELDDTDSNSFWSNAIDGMVYETVSTDNFKAYVLVIKDPSRVFVGTSSSNYSSATEGMRFAAMASKYDAEAMINGGEFSDTGGTGNGATPIGLTYSQGKCVWGSDTSATFIGITKDNKLYVSEGITKAKAESLGIRDAVSFQSGNVLITHEGKDVKLHYSDSNTGRAQRTAIGQREDGAIIMIVTDGRTASSIGATHNDMVEIMAKYGAVTAAKLDGGSSAIMYYDDYYDKYNIDKSTLDQYQLQGLVNNYKAFTNPRRLPTYWIVSKEA